MPDQDIVRVLRIIEYVGPRNQVEQQVEKSIHGSRKHNGVTIRAATIGNYPEILGCEKLTAQEGECDYGRL